LSSVILEASELIESPKEPPTLLADAGTENVNRGVDELIESGVLHRVLARVDISSSNSLIESWWRVLKHQWLYLNSLDSLATVRRLVEYYVGQHNVHLPHSAFRGQTPDEIVLRARRSRAGVSRGEEARSSSVAAQGKQSAIVRELRVKRTAYLSTSTAQAAAEMTGSPNRSPVC